MSGVLETISRSRQKQKKIAAVQSRVRDKLYKTIYAKKTLQLELHSRRRKQNQTVCTHHEGEERLPKMALEEKKKTGGKT